MARTDQRTKLIKGTVTNDDAAAGYIGEYVYSTIAVGAISPAGSGTWTNITSITLSAGDWDVTGFASSSLNSATVSSYFYGAVSAYSGITTTDHVDGDNRSSCQSPTSTYNVNLPIPNVRVTSDGTNLKIAGFTVNSTQTIYLKAVISYSAGTPKFHGRLSARRVR